MASRFVEHEINFEHANGPSLVEMRKVNRIPLHYFTDLQSQCFLTLYTHEGARSLYNIAHTNYVSGAFAYSPRTPIKEYRCVAGSEGSLKLIGSEIARYYRELARYTLERDGILYIARRDLKVVGAETHHTAHKPGVALYEGRPDTFYPLTYLKDNEADCIARDICWETLFDPEQVKDTVVHSMTRECDGEEVARLLDASTIMQREIFVQP